MGYFILDGKKPTPATNTPSWQWWFENDATSVGEDLVNDVRVRTDFLGIGIQLFNDKPCLFQTIAFRGSMDQVLGQYATWEEAEAGHRAVVEKVRAETKAG